MSQDETDIQTTDNELTKIKHLLLAGKPLDGFEVDGQSALEYVVEKGNYELTQEILTLKPDASLIQATFEIAADTGKIEIASLLVNAGADYNYYYGYNRGEGQRCPICFRAIDQMELEACEHLIASSDSGYTPVFFRLDEELEDFYNKLEELANLICSLVNDVFEKVLASAPKDLQIVFETVRKYGYFYWTHKEGIITFEWDVHNYLGDAGYDYFHADPDFARKVEIEAEQALAWLQDNYPELYQESDDYESEISELGREEENIPKGENEISQDLATQLERETGLTPPELASKLYNHISEEIGEGTPEEYMQRIEEMRAAGKLQDMEEFMQMMIKAFLEASKDK